MCTFFSCAKCQGWRNFIKTAFDNRQSQQKKANLLFCLQISENVHFQPLLATTLWGVNSTFPTKAGAVDANKQTNTTKQEKLLEIYN